MGLVRARDDSCNNAMRKYRSTQTATAHFRRMEESKALLVAGSVRVGVEMLGRILAGDDRTAAARILSVGLVRASNDSCKNAGLILEITDPGDEAPS